MADEKQLTTSQLGFEYIRPKLSAGRRRVFDGLIRWPGSTALELEQSLNYPSAHKRLPELMRLGHVKTREARTCSITGRPAATWWPIENGKLGKKPPSRKYLEGVEVAARQLVAGLNVGMPLEAATKIMVPLDSGRLRALLVALCATE